MNYRHIAAAVFAVFVFCTLETAVFALSLTLAPSGGSSFILQGSDFKSVAAVDVTINYDTASLGKPQVAQGSLANGSFFAANPNMAGQIRIAFVHASGVSGSGPVATITFTPTGSGSAALPSLKINSILDAKSAEISATAVSSATAAVAESPAVSGSWKPLTADPSQGSAAGSQGSQPVPAQPASPAATSQTVPTWLGTVTLPGGEAADTKGQAKSAEPLPPPAPQPQERPSQAESAHDTAPTPVKRAVALPAPPAAILERFRTYRGEISAAALKPLFAATGGDWITQDPAIALADGSAPVTLTMDLGSIGMEAPSFAFRGMEMTELKPLGGSSWQITGVPAAGKVKVSLSVNLESAEVDVPLTVVPPLPKEWEGASLTESALNRFLVERGVDRAPKGDLNGDGKRDYLDDYIMVGHFLRRSVSLQKPKGAVPQGNGKD